SVETRITGAAVTGVRAAAFPARLDECTGATLAARSHCQMLLRLDTSLAGAADATLRVTEVSGVVHDVPAGLGDRRLHSRRRCRTGKSVQVRHGPRHCDQGARTPRR